MIKSESRARSEEAREQSRERGPCKPVNNGPVRAVLGPLFHSLLCVEVRSLTICPAASNTAGDPGAQTSPPAGPWSQLWAPDGSEGEL